MVINIIIWVKSMNMNMKTSPPFRIKISILRSTQNGAKLATLINIEEKKSTRKYMFNYIEVS